MGSLSLPHYSYLRFLIERGVAPAPAIIRVVAHSEEWANRQVMEELRSTWPAANSALLEVGTFLSCDLLVVTFDGDLPVNPCAFEQKYPAPWVIFYGLEMRRISVFQAGKANKLFRTTRKLDRIHCSLRGTGLLRLLKAGIRFWKHRWHR